MNIVQLNWLIVIVVVGPSHARSIIISVIIINAPILLHAIKSRNFQFNFKISNSKLFCRIFYRAFTSQSGGWLSKTMPMLTMLNQPNQTKPNRHAHTQNDSPFICVCVVCALAINRESKQDKHFVYASFDIAKPKFVCVCTHANCW